MKIGIATASAQLWHAVAGTELRRNVLETYGTRLLTVALSFATAVVIARELGPSGRGFYAVAATVGALGVQFGNLGLHASNIYHIAKDRTLLPALLGNMLAVVFLASVVTALSWIGFARWPNISPVHGTLLLLALASIPVGLAYLFTQGLLLGINDVRAYNKIECGGKLLALALICILGLVHGAAVELFYGLTLFSVILSFLWAFLRLRRISAEPPAVSLAIFRQSIGISTKAYMIAFFGFLVLRIDLLMVKYMLGATEAGYYSISQVLAENTMMFPVVLGLLLFPKLSAIKDREDKLRLANKAVLVTAALTLPVVLISASAAAPIISVAFGRNFLPAVSPFAWLMPGTYFLGIETVMVQLLNSEGFPPIIVVAWIAATITNVALNFWAIPRYGITGASVVSSVCYFLMFLIVSAVVWKRNYKRHPMAACAPIYQAERQCDS
jgi:O-antigen/teichoic acid export membrane protein